MVSWLSIVTPPAGAVISPPASASAETSATHRVAHTGPNAPGAPTNVTVTLTPAGASVSWSAPTSVPVGYPVLGYTVTASPGGETCTVSSPSTSCVVPGLVAGVAATFSVVATSAGGTGPASTSSASVTPSQSASSVTLDAWPAAPENVGTPVTFTTFLNVGSGGTVEFDLAGTPIAGCKGQVVTSGYASCTTNSLAAGTNSVSATYSGDSNFTSSSSNVLTYAISSTKLSAVGSPLVVSSLSGPYNTSLTLTTSGGSGSGAISYVAADGTASGCTVTGTSLTVSEPGTCLVTATQASDGSFLGQSSNVTTVTMFESYAAVWGVIGYTRDCAYGGTLPDCTSTTAATTTYSCSSGTLSGSNCTTSYSATATPSCPNGGSYNASWGECEVFPGMSQSQCTQSGYSWYASGGYCYYFLAASYTYSCPSGGSPSGKTCIVSSPATVTYSCPSGGTLSGSSCITSYGWVNVAEYGWTCPLGGSLSSSTCSLSGGSGAAEVPGAPTSVIASSSSGAATLKWIAPTRMGSSSISGYTVTASDATDSSHGGQTCSTTTTRSCTVTGLTNGDTYTFTVVATNVAGNSLPSDPSNVVGPGAGPNAPTGLVLGTASSYTSAMNALSPTSYWPMSDPAGSTTVNDASGNVNTGTITGTATLGAPGPLATGAAAISLPGTSYISTTIQDDNPQSTSMSVWFNSTSSGAIMGFSSSQNPTAPANFDRSLWIDPTGHLVGGIYDNSAGTTREAVSSSVVNDGSWHFAVFTFGPSGENLYLDGALVGNNTAGTTAQVYNGYWSIGYQDTTNWPDQPSSEYFTGSLAGVGITPSVLTPSQVQSLYATAQSNATLSWSASSPNGLPVTLYTVTAHYVSGGVAPTTDVTACTTSGATTCSLTGLTNGDTYDFSVTATNAVATSAASVTSNDFTVPSVPNAPTGLVASPTNLISDPTLASAPSSWTYSYLTMGTANGDMTITSPGTSSAAWVYYGTGTSSNEPYAGTAPITVVPGKTYDYSAFIDATAATSGTPGFMIFTTGYAWETGLYQAAGSSGSLTGTWTAPAGVTQIFLSPNLDSITVAAGQTITWSHFFFGPVGSTNLSWVAPNPNGWPVTQYGVTAHYLSGGFTPTTDLSACTTGVTSCIPSGLTPGDTYDFSVNATNVVGTSPDSSVSGNVTAPGSAPGAPTLVTATPGGAQANVSWTAPSSSGGAAITGYTVTAADSTTPANGGETCTTSGALNCMVAGLTNGDSYAFSVVATNVNGTSAPSSPSNSVVPANVPSAPTGLVASPANQIADPTLAAAPSSWPQSYQATLGTANGDFNIVNAGTNSAAFTYYGNGNTGSYGYVGSQTITVVPGQTYNYSAFIDATAASGGDPGFFIYTPTNTWEGGLYQSPGTSGYLVGTWTAPAGVTQIFVEVNLDATTVTPGATISWSNFFFAPVGTTSLSWSASNANGSPVTQYVVTAEYVSGGVAPTTSVTACTTSGATSCSPTGLTTGDIYDFSVTATNANGTSLVSTPSSTVMGP